MCCWDWMCASVVLNKIVFFIWFLLFFRNFSWFFKSIHSENHFKYSNEGNFVNDFSRNLINALPKFKNYNLLFVLFRSDRRIPKRFWFHPTMEFLQFLPFLVGILCGATAVLIYFIANGSLRRIIKNRKTDSKPIETMSIEPIIKEEKSVEDQVSLKAINLGRLSEGKWSQFIWFVN